MADESGKTYYEILGISADADDAVVEAAYRQASQKWRMRKSGASSKEVRNEAENMEELLVQARKILLDPERRIEYDRQLAGGGDLALPHAPSGPGQEAPPETPNETVLAAEATVPQPAPSPRPATQSGFESSPALARDAAVPHLPTPSGELQLFEQHGVPTPAPVPAFKPLHAIDKGIGYVEMVALIILIFAMMLLGTTQVVMREIFNTGLPWADPLLRNMVLWAGMLGAMVATQSGRHLNMDAFARLLPVVLRRWVDVVVNLTATVTCGVLVWVSIPYLQDEISAESEAIVGALLPWHVQLIFPISFGVMAFRFALFMLDGLAGGKPQSHQIPVSEIAAFPEEQKV